MARVIVFIIATAASGLSACGGSSSNAGQIKVFKYDGSVQCESEGTSVDDMQMELVDAGIDVLCGQKSADGRLYCAACGCGTGAINVYTIFSANQPDAEAIGFGPVSDLESYQDTPCPES